MLSALIPVYNHNIKKLVDVLHKQLVDSKIKFEILCIDDYSKPYYRKINREISSIQGIQYIELDQNLGRAKIRNLLASKAIYEKLLFLDSDSKIVNRFFIPTYLDYLDDAPVLNGGRRYTSRRPTNPQKILHYIYGTKRESRSVKERNKKPGLYFHTNNFVIDKQLVLDFPFEESLKGYGYEDLAMASTLQQQKTKIMHLDNYIIHKDIDTTDDFLAKINESMISLAYLYEQQKIQNTPLLKLYRILVKSHLKDNFISAYLRYDSWILKNLYSSKPSLRKLDMYKLYHFCIAIDSLDET